VPLLAIVAYKHPRLSVFIGILLIAANMAINFAYAMKYHLKIGLLHIANYYLLQGIMAKPWSHLQNIAQGIMLAQIYRRVLKYRDLGDAPERAAQFPNLHRIFKNKMYGYLLFYSGLIIIFADLMSAWHWEGHPMDASDFGNSVYYAITRPSFVTGAMLILVSIFTGHFQVARGLLSTNVARFIAKCVPIACMIVILIVEVLFCSDAMPVGLTITAAIAVTLGVGLILASIILSLLLTTFLEFPIARLLQIGLLKHLSHDDLLRPMHERKQEEFAEVSMRHTKRITEITR